MTSAQYRAAIDIEPRPLVDADMKGAARQGIWWVAWRQHRWQITALLGIVAVGAAALIILRSRVVSVFHEFGCDLFPAVQGRPYGGDCVDADGVQVWLGYGFDLWSAWAHLAMVGGPIVLGVFAAAPIFTREFARGTHVLVLTQSVGRMRWFVAKTTVVGVSLVGGLLLLGFLMAWTDGAVGVTAYGALNRSNFFARGIVPAAIGLMAFGLALAIGMVTRNVLAALVAGMLVGGAVLAGLAVAQPYVLPAERTSLPITTMFPPMTQSDIDREMSGGTTQNAVDIDVDRAFVRAGYLGAGGDPVEVSGPAMTACYEDARDVGRAAAVAAGLTEAAPADNPGAGGASVAVAIDQDVYNSPEYQTAFNASMVDCMTSQGIAATYQDYLPGSMLWPLRWAITGICVILAALFLGAAAWRLKSAAAKR